MTTTVQPLADGVLCERIVPEERTAGGIIKPAQALDRERGFVVGETPVVVVRAVGPDVTRAVVGKQYVVAIREAGDIAPIRLPGYAPDAHPAKFAIIRDKAFAAEVLGYTLERE